MRLKQVLTAAIATAWIGGVNAEGAYFQDLGFFQPVAVSGDGRVVAGSLNSEATRWTREEGFIGLGTLPGDTASRTASVPGNQINFDGSVIVGFSSSPSGEPRGFRWTQDDGIAALESADESVIFSFPAAVSADGTTVVGSGSSQTSSSEPIIWTVEDGAVLLSELSPSGTPRLGRATGISADGTTLALRNADNGVENEAARWRADSGVTLLGHLSNGIGASLGNGVSGDGNVFFGSSQFVSDPSQAFRWTESEGIVGLGTLPGRSSNATASTFDGSVVVGILNNVVDGSLAGAFTWDQVNGMRDLQSVLVNEFDVDLTGWQLDSALAVSDDGNVIVGLGRNPNDERSGWVVDLTATSTGALLDQGSFGPIGTAPGFEANFGFGGAIDQAQTLTVGVAGALEQVDLYLRREAQTTEPLLLDIRAVDAGGRPTTNDTGPTVLGSIEIPASEVSLSGDWLEVDVSALGVVVQEGERVALVLQSNQDLGNVAAGYSWRGSEEGELAGGSSFSRFRTGAWSPSRDDPSRSADLYFRMFVRPLAVPEPTSSSLLAFVASGLCRRRSR